MQPTNLNQYYQSQGLSLPSVQARAATAAQAGIQNYTGSAGQNQQLLAFLTKSPVQNPSAPALPGTTQPAAQPMGAITTASLAPVTPVNVPTPPVPTAPAIPQQNLADQIIQQTQVADTENQKLGQGLSAKIYDLLPQLQGENAALGQAQLAAGVGQKKQELQTLNSQILKKQAEISQDDIQLIANMRAEERRDTLLPFAQQGQAKLQGDAQILRALKTSEIGVLNAQVLAKQGDIALAQETAKEAVDAKFAPYKEAINLYKAQLEAIQPLLSADEKKQARAQEIKGQLAMKEVDKISNLQKDALANAIANNAPQSVLNKISSARSLEDITSVGSRYLISPADRLDQELKGLQLRKARGEFATPTGNETQTTGVEQDTASASSDPVGYFSSVIKANKIKGSTTLESLLGVIGAAKELADFGTKEKRFKGAAPIRLTPGIFKGPKQLTTEGAINAINLKVQQWASGASLTTEQTKQVKKFTPDLNDTDKQIRTKLNNLTNFMMQQGKSSLATQGVNIQVPKVDLFGNSSTVSPDVFWQSVDQTLSGSGGIYQTAGYDPN